MLTAKSVTSALQAITKKHRKKELVKTIDNGAVTPLERNRFEVTFKTFGVRQLLNR